MRMTFPLAPIVPLTAMVFEVPSFVKVSVIGAIGLAALVVAYRPLRETTLLAAWWWAVAALTVLVGVELGASGASDHAGWVDPARYIAAIGTLAPLMALLGAKRPQHRAWQFIVLTLVVVLALPAGEALLPGREGVSLHTARAVFLLLLVIVGLGNGLGTRYWAVGVLYVAGQLTLLAPFLPWFDPTPSRSQPFVGLALIVAALALSWLLARRTSTTSHGWNRAWIDFRNLYGAVWGLRVMERTNAVRSSDNLPRLTWHGFTASPSVEQTDALRALMRRFVSSEWLDRRLADDA